MNIPGITLDIDGVLMRQWKKLPFSGEILQILKTPVKFMDKRNSFKGIIPHILLTNGGGYLESEIVKKLNKTFEIEENSPRNLKKKDLILNFTPLRSIMTNFQNDIVLIDGIGNVESIALDCGIRKYITLKEYQIAFDILVPNIKANDNDCQNIIQILEKRLSLNVDKNSPIQIDAVFILNNPTNWEAGIQIITDLCSTENGKIGKIFDDKLQKNIPIYIVSDDLLKASTFGLSRLDIGSFVTSLKSVYHKLYNREIDLEICGKPRKIAFEYAKEQLNLQAKQNGIGISNYYMIGDNPSSDIRGANQNGFVSILVKTGVYSGSENSKEDPAQYFVDNLEEAIKIIFELEGLEIDLKDVVKNDYYADIRDLEPEIQKKIKN